MNISLYRFTDDWTFSKQTLLAQNKSSVGGKKKIYEKFMNFNKKFPCSAMDVRCSTYSLIHFFHSFSSTQQTHERLRHFQMNGGPQQSFEETIHRVSSLSLSLSHSTFSSFHIFLMQLKVQEAMRKKEKFQREHEEVSHD